MNEDNNQASMPASMKPARKFSWTWALPVIALMIGIILLHDSWSNRGIDIVVQFDDAEGIEANTTLVKYRNVEIGRVEQIRFAEDGESIRCYIKIDPEMRKFLRIDSQFWVVRPRIGASGISGVGTLLSGAYINMQPGEEETLTDAFLGLNSPPLASPTEAGLKLTLVSTGGEALREGNPVLYRGTNVGVVESIDFNVEDRNIQYQIFVRAPYDQLVTTNTFFWNASGVSVYTSVDGIQVDMASLESFISGGVEFDVPDDLFIGDRVTSPTTFQLYPNETATYDARQYPHLVYMILVEETVSGLAAGAPVEYRGIKIGRVASPYLGFFETQAINDQEDRIPVILHIEPGRLAQHQGYELVWFREQFESWIKSGLEARIETANYITGSMRVSLDMSGNEIDQIEQFGEFNVIPVVKDSFNSFIEKADNLLANLNQLPLEEFVEAAKQTANSVAVTSENASATLQTIEQLVASMETTIEEANQTLQSLQPESAMYEQVVRNMDELQRTLLMLQPVISDIQQKPNALLFSEPLPEDKQPRKQP